MDVVNKKSDATLRKTNTEIKFNLNLLNYSHDYIFLFILLYLLVISVIPFRWNSGLILLKEKKKRRPIRLFVAFNDRIPSLRFNLIEYTCTTDFAKILHERIRCVFVKRNWLRSNGHEEFDVSRKLRERRSYFDPAANVGQRTGTIF